MSRDPTEDAHCRLQEQNQKHICASTKSLAPKTTISLLGPQEKAGGLSRSLSRSRSTRNLQQNRDLSSSSSLSSALENREPKIPQDLSLHKQLPSVSLPSIPFSLSIAQTELAASSNKASSTIIQEDDESPISGFGKDTESDTEPSEGHNTSSVTTEIETTTVKLPPDGICNDVYRSYEMPLPESIAVDHILAKNEDTYNYEVFTCSPLQDPPRLPNAMESIVITERSKEEKNIW
eukprot:CAMPEP_0197176586 /NCGR_PEP_ID=MMETSP1423-20130617/2460_1 /TAXON_ID=476441 /ORGANISM="Pseudo-nitzschia heimii, Strain UNC1101" /LENGTH=234 /DNA_ID=CAMNT_0042625979 /DNA_START=404 /DNA_END=1105 /DNA_ORIENTATION=+